MMNNNNTTLFKRYKDMINFMWQKGERRYNSKELNFYVGVYELQTGWKRMNNNPYYTTRCYQTQLKQLGCITMIKRGLWQINAPIPEWFGSFHIKGLKGGFDESNKYADHGCIYWKTLPAEYKVNPWMGVDKSIKVSTILGPLDLNNPTERAQYINNNNNINNNNKTTIMKITKALTMWEVKDIPLLARIDGLTVNVLAGTYKSDGSDQLQFDMQQFDYYFKGKEIGFETASVLVNAVDSVLADVIGNDIEPLVKEAILNDIASSKSNNTKNNNNNNSSSDDKKYTEEDVNSILKDFVAKLKSEVEDAIDYGANNLNDREIVDITFDSWNRSVDVEILTSELVSALMDEVSARLDTFIDQYEPEVFTLQD